jgi:hypothetical protein
MTFGETFTFTVCVRNDIGYGPYSEPSNEITPYLDPELNFTGPRRALYKWNQPHFMLFPIKDDRNGHYYTKWGAAAGIDPIVINLNNTGSRQSFTIRPEMKGISH